MEISVQTAFKFVHDYTVTPNFHVINSERSYHLIFRYIQLCLIGTDNFVFFFFVFHTIYFHIQQNCFLMNLIPSCYNILLQ